MAYADRRLGAECTVHPTSSEGDAMNLALLGGTGRTGQLLIDQALARGHHLRVLARDPSRLHRHETPIAAVTGDARDPQAIARLLEGADAVLSALGPVPGGATDTMTLAARALIDQMPAHGLRRLVTLTGAGVPHPGDQPGVIDRLVRLALRLSQPAVLNDATAHADLIRAADLDWTVVRVPRLTDGPAAPVIAGRVGDITPFVTRASVAAFMLEAVETGSYLRQAPALSNHARRGAGRT